MDIKAHSICEHKNVYDIYTN